MSRENERWEDDGRTVADMSEVSGVFGRPARRSAESKESAPEEERFLPPMTPKERLRYVFSAMGAALAIGGAFLVGLGLVIAILLLIWN